MVWTAEKSRHNGFMLVPLHPIGQAKRKAQSLAYAVKDLPITPITAAADLSIYSRKPQKANEGHIVLSANHTA